MKAAGFTVEREHEPVKYIVILQSAWCNDSGSGISYDSDLVGFDKRDTAIKWGFRLRDSDDFNIGVLTNGALTSFDWMAKPLAATAAMLAQIAESIGVASLVEGNADAE
ncbi:TPA: antitoxin [Yersinia enterocolitica]|nr:antitoxin [Yersinia enterocolitica]HDL7834243.1 antitoxin [Yersinia enterocolitica]HDL7875095.1 antitoxin [Yersinia enterocolitica]HDL7887663.1 antitoxin [Yersinia enterocolitica]HDL7896274.1 antitoxin [Yersinia enterocolitica]